MIGDADWIRDSNQFFPFFDANNSILLENLVDWLTLDEDLIAVRSRMPRDRRLTDFLAEERRARELLHQTDADTLDEFEKRSRLESEALRSARRRQWWRMLWPVMASLAALLGFGALWNLHERRSPGSRAPEER